MTFEQVTEDAKQAWLRLHGPTREPSPEYLQGYRAAAYAAGMLAARSSDPQAATVG